jgi:hypothetical protein
LGRANPPRVFENVAPIVDARDFTIADGRDMNDDPESRTTLRGRELLPMLVSEPPGGVRLNAVRVMMNWEAMPLLSVLMG